MRKRLLRAFWIGNALTLVIVVAFAAVTVIMDIKTDAGSLRAILHTATAWTMEATSNLQSLADKIAESAAPLKVTFLMPNGIILAEAGVEGQNGLQLIGQQEVQQALQKSMGEDLSFRDSVIFPSLNAATVLSGRLVLHLSNPINEFYYILTVYLPLILLLALLMVGVSRALLNPVSKNILRQLRQIQDMLEGAAKREEINPQHYYPELRPALENIVYLIDRMQYDLVQINKIQDMQRDFVDNSSHELKSPLTSIAGFAEIIYEDPDMEKEERQEYLGYILAECQRMIAIINDILLLERQERGKAESKDLVDTIQIAQEVALALQPQAQAREIVVAVSGQGQVRAASRDVYDLLRNLMSNAIRYGKQGGWLKVEVQGRKIKVSDNGVGIAQEHLERIFEKFYRVDSARHRQDGGSGLGLAIVAAITNRYGAKLTVDSSLGRGSAFTVVFPEDD